MAAGLFTNRRQLARSAASPSGSCPRGGTSPTTSLTSRQLEPSPSRADHRRTRRPCHPRAISGGHQRYVADSHGHSAWTVHQDRPLLTWRSGAARTCMACKGSPLWPCCAGLADPMPVAQDWSARGIRAANGIRAYLHHVCHSRILTRVVLPGPACSPKRRTSGSAYRRPLGGHSLLSLRFYIL
jgi:hypothetical protein